jgi:ATP-dependent RNA helicase DeaD
MPIVDGIVRRNETRVQAVILCPTRELALQVSRELTVLGKHRVVKIAAVYGGAPMARQIQELSDGVHILVGTPGRVLDHLQRGTLDPAAVRVLVLDESDEMLSMGFLPQINDILSFLPEAHQTLLFSATLPPDIQRMAETRLREPQFLTLSGDHIGALEVTHLVYSTSGDKLNSLVQILETEDPESAIIFCNTRDETKRVAAFLQQRGYAAEWLNADLPQQDRESVMAATRRGRLRFLVATDVAARGIDISHLTHVINHDFPESAELYVHRTGRTGRAGRTGVAVSQVAPSDVGNPYLLRLTYGIRPKERQLPSARELKTRAETDVIDMLARDFADQKVPQDDIALARRLMTHPLGEVTIGGLIRRHLGASDQAQELATQARRGRLPKPALDSGSAEPRSPEENDTAEDRRSPRTKPRSASTDAVTAGTESGRRDAEPTLTRPRRRRAPARAGAQNRSSGLPSGDTDVHGEARFSYTVIDVADAPRPLRDLSEGLIEIYVNVGRKDGARPEDFRAIIEAKGDLSAQDTGYVRVKQRHTFIGVRKGSEKGVIDALNGTIISGRQATAELSRSRGQSEGDSLRDPQPEAKKKD